MQRTDGIGKNWANNILSKGYVADNKNPTTTEAKIWNKHKQTFDVIEIGLGLQKLADSRRRFTSNRSKKPYKK